MTMPVIAALLCGFGPALSGRADEPAPSGYPGQSLVAGQSNAAERGAILVQRALREGHYPWYDQDTDRVRPVWPPKRPWVKWLRERVEGVFKRIDKLFQRFSFSGLRGLKFAGESIGRMVLLGILVGFFVVLLILWARRDQTGTDGRETRTRSGTIARMTELPDGLAPSGGDPWDEARRRRAAGDFAGATVCLFAHQLLALDQLGMIRLGPGRTGRQYVRGLRDPDLLDPIRETLAMFEDVYYGRRVPAADAFDAVWRKAQSFEQHRKSLGASR
jgi:hypothetical protein